MAKDPVIASLRSETEGRVHYELTVVGPQRRVVGEAVIPADGDEQRIEIVGGVDAEAAARRVVGRILRRRATDSQWPLCVQHVS